MLAAPTCIGMIQPNIITATTWGIKEPLILVVLRGLPGQMLAPRTLTPRMVTPTTRRTSRAPTNWRSKRQHHGWITARFLGDLREPSLGRLGVAYVHGTRLHPESLRPTW